MVLNKVERLNTSPGGLLRVSNDGDDRMGAKMKTQKNPMPNFRALKISTKQNKFDCTFLF